MASDGYRQAMGLRLIAGRDLLPDDGPTSEPVVVVNQTLPGQFGPARTRSASS
jgi:hypothetical protein